MGCKNSLEFACGSRLDHHEHALHVVTPLRQLWPELLPVLVVELTLRRAGNNYQLPTLVQTSLFFPLFYGRVVIMEKILVLK